MTAIPMPKDGYDEMVGDLVTDSGDPKYGWWQVGESDYRHLSRGPSATEWEIGSEGTNFVHMNANVWSKVENASGTYSYHSDFGGWNDGDRDLMLDGDTSTQAHLDPYSP